MYLLSIVAIAQAVEDGGFRPIWTTNSCPCGDLGRLRIGGAELKGSSE